jgi:pimeloyl-ACP methyl ester carboxylesterase
MNNTINDISLFIDGNQESRTIIFVHGFPFDHYMWDSQLRDFRDNYCCVTYDIRGLGTSPAGDGQFTIETFVDDLEEIINQLNLDKPVLCGLSMGGYISLRAVERMQKTFSALILCDTKSTPDDNEGKLKRSAAIKQINSGHFESLIESFARNCFGDTFVREKKTLFDEVLNRSKKSNPTGVKGCLLAMAGRTDTTSFLSKITIPTLIISGREDKLTPPDVMKQMADQIYNSKFVLVEGSGHMTPIEKPGAVGDAIKKFLSQHEL